MPPTRDVSREYHAHQAGADDGAAFSPDSPFGGDHDAVRSGRIDAGRSELHRLTLAQQAQTGCDYDQALDQVIAGARSGLVTLSAQARVGLGLGGDTPPDPTAAAGVKALTAAPVADPTAHVDVADAARFADSMAHCASPQAVSAPLLRRAGQEVSERLIDRFAAQGGGRA